MHPAVSVIFFTVSSGAGFGLMVLLGLGWPMPRGPWWVVLIICGLAGGLAVAGLLSSTFHLGHPERAWRAFSQWRSSWLSREGIAAVVTLILFGLYALVWMVTGQRLFALGLPVAAGAIATIYTTSMIYAQLKTVPSWHTWLTSACYLAFGLSSGFLLLGALGFSKGYVSQLLPALIALSLMISWGIKALWWKHSDEVGFSQTGSDVGTATGLGHLGDVRLFEKPHSGENYLTKEMVHQIGRKHAQKLRKIAVFFGLIVPFFMAAFSAQFHHFEVFMIVGFISMMAGLFAERWLFFAQAKHAVSLYYT